MRFGTAVLDDKGSQIGSMKICVGGMLPYMEECFPQAKAF